MTNYRPISLLPVVSKILERCIAERISEYLESNKLLTDRQFGFRSGLGTASGIANLVSFISEAFHAGKFVNTMFCDLSKAFHCVSHDLLSRKLPAYNFVSGKSLSDGGRGRGGVRSDPRDYRGTPGIYTGTIGFSSLCK